ncbi:hypothetical protein KK103_12015 [Curtobacterium flaccumfaciens pv. flaccumfaciens]|uniref:O-antigen ligase family protein n=1 Tax=Curtobacterium flaccumfaciens pv. flaccumfaciens TaxID=138532 RepID=A0A9Q2W6K7_9MICO|nr:O-antigen ligase family protein [Curtobacterium flaccumfaciens]MBT1542491.1 hypothetical protein [Curtobacterium flaccumfaciens pv. flaccumfaciens]
MRGTWIIAGIVAVMLAVVLVLEYPPAAFAVVAAVAACLIPRRAVLLVAASAVLLLMVVFPVQYLSEYGSLSRGVVFLCPAITIFAFVRQRARPSFGSPKLLLLACLYAIVLVATTTAHSNTADTSLLWATLVPAGCFTVLALAVTSQQLRSIKNVIVLIAGAEAIYAVGETTLHFTPLWTTEGPDRASQIIPGLIRAQGTLGHPLPLAMLCVVGIAILLSRRHASGLAGTVLGVGVLCAGIVATGSRSALVVVALMLAFSIGRRIWSVLTVAVLAGGLGALVLAAGGFFRSDTWINFATGDSLSHRNGALDAVPGLLTGQSVGSVLFGNGYFSASGLFARGLLQQGTFYAIDNQFVTSLVETGLVGVALLVALCVGLWLRAGAYRMLVGGVVAFFFTFDILSWPSAAALFAATVVLVVRRNDDNAPTQQSQVGASESVSSSVPSSLR